MYKNVYLKRGKEESMKRFHPWVFSGALHHMDEGLREGEIVNVISAGGEYIGRGHFQIGSIAVRILTFDDEMIDDDFWYNRLKIALDVRIAIGIADNPQNNTYRLVHGEGDNLPGLVIDCYGKTAVVQAHSVGMHEYRMEISRQLVRVMEHRIENVYYKRETTLPYKAELGQENGFIYGDTEENVALENGLKFTSIGSKDRRQVSSLTSVRTVRCSNITLKDAVCSICSAIQVASLSMLCVAGQNSFTPWILQEKPSNSPLRTWNSISLATNVMRLSVRMLSSSWTERMINTTSLSLIRLPLQSIVVHYTML